MYVRRILVLRFLFTEIIINHDSPCIVITVWNVPGNLMFGDVIDPTTILFYSNSYIDGYKLNEN